MQPEYSTQDDATVTLVREFLEQRRVVQELGTSLVRAEIEAYGPYGAERDLLTALPVMAADYLQNLLAYRYQTAKLAALRHQLYERLAI